jgi:predicted peptidase
MGLVRDLPRTRREEMRLAKRYVTALLIAFALFHIMGCVSGASVQRSTRNFPQGTGFLTRTVTVDKKERKFAVFVPRDYSAAKKYPAIVFLHGLFESGRDARRCLSAGLGPVIAKDPQHWPFISVFPQTMGSWRGAANERLVLACLDDVEASFSIDKDRVILAGLSYGGRATWEIGAKHRDRFAALVPMSGDAVDDACNQLKDTPVWAFHYSGDPFMPARDSKRMVEKIREAGGKAKLTEFNSIGHDCWTRACSETDVVSWMLQQRRGDSAVVGVPVEP